MDRGRTDEPVRRLRPLGHRVLAVQLRLVHLETPGLSAQLDCRSAHQMNTSAAGTHPRPSEMRQQARWWSSPKIHSTTRGTKAEMTKLRAMLAPLATSVAVPPVNRAVRRESEPPSLRQLNASTPARTAAARSSRCRGPRCSRRMRPIPRGTRRLHMVSPGKADSMRTDTDASEEAVRGQRLEHARDRAASAVGTRRERREDEDDGSCEHHAGLAARAVDEVACDVRSHGRWWRTRRK